VLEGYFIKEVLLADLARPVRLVVCNDFSKLPFENDLLVVTLGAEAAGFLQSTAAAGCRNVGVLHLGDECAKWDRSFYASADYVLRHYWFSHALATTEPQLTKVLWIPQGYRTGLGPTNPAQTLPVMHRHIEGFFAGSLHGHQQERQTMIASVQNAKLPFMIVPTAGFGQGYGPSSYAGLLGDSKFALVPGGNSPETIRLYDALEQGAIPIILESPFIFSPDALGAIGKPPFVLLDNWLALPKVYSELSQMPANRLEDRRCEILDWWSRFKVHQQHRVREVIEASFARSATWS